MMSIWFSLNWQSGLGLNANDDRHSVQGEIQKASISISRLPDSWIFLDFSTVSWRLATVLPQLNKVFPFVFDLKLLPDDVVQFLSFVTQCIKRAGTLFCSTDSSHWSFVSLLSTLWIKPHHRRQSNRWLLLPSMAHRKQIVPISTKHTIYSSTSMQRHKGGLQENETNKIKPHV